MKIYKAQIFSQSGLIDKDFSGNYFRSIDFLENSLDMLLFRGKKENYSLFIEECFMTKKGIIKPKIKNNHFVLNQFQPCFLESWIDIHNSIKELISDYNINAIKKGLK